MPLFAPLTVAYFYRIRPISLHQVSIGARTPVDEQKIRCPQQRIDLNHVRHVEPAAWTDEIYIVSRSLRRRQLRQMAQHEVFDLIHLKRQYEEKTQYASRAGERREALIGFGLAAHGTR